METWTPPDYQLDELIGFGSTGEVWRAGAPGGRTVALKRLHRRLDDHAREALVADVERVAAVGSPHLMPVREVLVEAGETVLVLDHAAGGSLAALLARRVLLDAGEVVTIAAPLAGALADAHAAGLVHGAVCPTAVLFTADGMPLLSDLCLGGLRAPERTFLRLAEPAPSPEQDVQDLAALCLQLLTGRARRSGALGNSLADHPWRPAEECATEADVPPGPVGLLAVLQAVLAADPGARPDAAELARALHSAHPPAPVQLNGPRAAVLPTARPPSPPPGRGGSGWSGSAGRSPSGAALLGRRAEVSGSRRAGRASSRSGPATRTARPGGWRGLPALLGAAVAALLAGGLVWAVGGAGPGAGDAALPARGSTAGQATGVGPLPPGAAAPPATPVPVTALPGDSFPGTSPPGSPPGGSSPPGSPPPGPGPPGAVPPAAPARSPAPPAAPERSGATGATATSRGEPRSPDWTQVLTRLDAARARAFARADPAGLRAVYVPGSQAHRVDAAALARLRDAGGRVTGLRHRVMALEQQAASGPRARLRVTDVLEPHQVLGADGRVLERRHGRAATSYEVVLLHLAGGWRIERLDAEPPP